MSLRMGTSQAMRDQGMRLVAIAHAAWNRHLTAEVRDHGLSAKQARILRLLHTSRPVTPTQLAERLGEQKSTLANTLTAMVQRGWIARVPHAHDTRSVLVQLTASGKRKVAALPTASSTHWLNSLRRPSRRRQTMAGPALQPPRSIQPCALSHGPTRFSWIRARLLDQGSRR